MKMLEQWFWRNKCSQLGAIYTADIAGAQMNSHVSLVAMKDKGLVGDRYAMDRGYWHPVESCQLTLIGEGDLQRALRRGAPNLDAGAHRRNLVVTGLHSRALLGKTIQIGNAVFRCTKPRPPCGYLDQLVGKGAAKALGNQSGLCLTVEREGLLTVGDSLVIME